MKLWLLEILACPIDHAFPLELTILNWKKNEKAQDEIANILEYYAKGSCCDRENPIHSEIRPEGLFVRDFLILKFQKYQDYLNQLLEKIKELDVVQDKSEWKGQEALKLIKTTIKDRLQATWTTLDKNPKMTVEKMQELLLTNIPDLMFLNVFKYDFEIEDGVIFCPQCHRWFPIFETIPQMLPDDLRQVDQDKAFKNKWNSIILFPK